MSNKEEDVPMNRAKGIRLGGVVKAVRNASTTYMGE